MTRRSGRSQPCLAREYAWQLETAGRETAAEGQCKARNAWAPTCVGLRNPLFSFTSDQSQEVRFVVRNLFSFHLHPGRAWLRQAPLTADPSLDSSRKGTDGKMPENKDGHIVALPHGFCLS